MRRLIDGLLVAAGFLCLGLGMAGTVIPLLPTVPFLLAAAICFARGSSRFHRWFQGTKIYRENLETYVEHRAMTVRKKRRALILMTVTMGAVAVLVPVMVMRVVLVAAILFNYWYFLTRIRTISEQEEAALRRAEQGRKQKAAAQNQTGNRGQKVEKEREKRWKSGGQ